MTILGENIKKFRNRAGMSMDDLAKVAGVGKSTISELESGKAKNPKSDTITKIANALNVSFDTLSSMEVEHEYVITDVAEAMDVILSQENLMLNGELLTDEARVQLANSIKMALSFAEEIQKKSHQ